MRFTFSLNFSFKSFFTFTSDSRLKHFLTFFSTSFNSYLICINYLLIVPCSLDKFPNFLITELKLDYVYSNFEVSFEYLLIIEELLLTGLRIMNEYWWDLEKKVHSKDDGIILLNRLSLLLLKNVLSNSKKN
jgi:hypothetical protein